jgi:long-subunit acyl-CoA synthetase (AMP-forming)
MNPLEAFATDASRADAPSTPPGGMPGPLAADPLAGLFAARVAATPDRAAVAVAGEAGVITWTWAELAAAALAAADTLAAAGLVAGDRVAHLGPHTADWLVVDLACLVGGFVHLPLHADSTAAEHRSQLAWLAPRGVVFSGGLARGGLAPSDVRGLAVVPPRAGRV